MSNLTTHASSIYASSPHSPHPIGHTHVKFPLSTLPKSYPSHCHLYVIPGSVIHLDRSMDSNVFVNGGSTSGAAPRRDESTTALSAAYLSILEESYVKPVSSVHEVQMAHADVMELEEEREARGNAANGATIHITPRLSLQEVQQLHPAVTQYQIIDLHQLPAPSFRLYGRFSATTDNSTSMIHIAQLNARRTHISPHPSLTIQRTQNIHSLLSTQRGPLRSAKVARIFYFIPKRQAFDKCIPELKKLAFGMELVQLFFYYTLRHCFALERPIQGTQDNLRKQKKAHSYFASECLSTLLPNTPVEIHIIRCSKTKKELNELGNQWNIHNEKGLSTIFTFFKEMRDEYDQLGNLNVEDGGAVNLLFLGMTRHSTTLKKNIAHLFSQKDNCALLSSYALDLWPSNTDEIDTCFTNTTLLNPKKTIIDSTQHASSDDPVPAWSNLTCSFARTIQTIAAAFNVSQYLAPAAEGAKQAQTLNGSTTPNNSNLMIHQVNHFFCTDISTTGKNAAKELIFWDEHASKAFRKSLAVPLDVDTMDTERSSTTSDHDSSHSIPTSQNGYNKENLDPALPSIRSRSVLSAVREEADSNLTAIGSLPRIPSKKSGNLQMSSTVSAPTGNGGVLPPPNLTQRADSRQSSSTTQSRSSSNSRTKRSKSRLNEVATDSDAASNNVVKSTPYWEYDSGYFRQASSKKWKEYNNNEPRHHSSYEQINMTQAYVLLYNPKKSIYMCLDGEQCRFSRDGEHFQLLHLGTFKDVNDTKIHQQQLCKTKKKRTTKSKMLGDTIPSLGDKWRSKDDKSIYFLKNVNDQGEEEWVEYRNKMIFSTYKEEERTHEHVILRDEDSGMIVKLIDGEAFWRYESSAGWESLSKGRFRKNTVAAS